MPDQLETQLRITLARHRDGAPDVDGLLDGARRLRRRRQGALVVATAVVVAAAVAVPTAVLGTRTTAQPVPAGPSTPRPSPPAPVGQPVIGRVSGTWTTPGVGALVATADHAFGIQIGAASDSVPTVVRIGDDGVKSVALPASSATVTPALMAANASAVYAVSQVPRRLVDVPDRIWRIDPNRLSVTASVELATTADAVAASDRGLYVATSTGIELLDPDTLRQIAEYTVPGAKPMLQSSDMVFSVVSTGPDVYAAYGDARDARLLRLSPTLDLRGTTPLPPGQGGALYGNACGAWLLDPDGSVRQITPSGLGASGNIPGFIAGSEAAVVACDGLDIATTSTTSALLHVDPNGHITARQTLPYTTGSSLAIDLTTNTLWTGRQQVERLALTTMAATLPSSAQTTAVAACKADALRLSRAFWVSPQSQTSMTGLLIHNVGAQACSLTGPVQAFVSDPGYPNVTAVADAFGMGDVNGTRVLAPSGSAYVILAELHSCVPQPQHRYHRVTLRLAGQQFVASLPDQSISTNPDFSGRRLSLAVDSSCPPHVSGFLPAMGHPSDVG